MPFPSAAEALFWTIRTSTTRGAIALHGAAAAIRRPCEPGVVLRALDTLYRRRRVDTRAPACARPLGRAWRRTVPATSSRRLGTVARGNRPLGRPAAAERNSLRRFIPRSNFASKAGSARLRKRKPPAPVVPAGSPPDGDPPQDPAERPRDPGPSPVRPIGHRDGMFYFFDRAGRVARIDGRAGAGQASQVIALFGDGTHCQALAAKPLPAFR